MTCLCTQGITRISPSGNFVTIISVPPKNPPWRTFCSFFEEAVPGLTALSQPNPAAPEVSLVSPLCSVSPHFSTAESLSLSGKDSLPLVHGEQGCPVTCPGYTYFSLLIFFSSQSWRLLYRAPSHPWLLQFGCGNEVPSAQHRAPGSAYACSEWGDHALADTSCLCCSFFSFPFSDHHSKLK